MISYTPCTFAQTTKWDLKRDSVYRILDNPQYMEDFFQKGELLISCFANFKNYKDEMRGDKDEGESFVEVKEDDGSTSLYNYESGYNAFILSTSTELNEQIIKDFNGSCAIRINHPTLFALEIYKKLPFILSGIEGSCNYCKSRIQFDDKEKNENSFLKNLDFKNDPLAKQKFMQITAGSELFLKHEKYRHQGEYRFIWFTSNPVHESILIKCPEAAQYCSKMFF